jgi:hypothetical protein
VGLDWHAPKTKATTADQATQRFPTRRT